jgi:hypothetical protein
MPSRLQRRRLLAGCLEFNEDCTAFSRQHETVWDTRIPRHYEFPEEVSARFSDLAAPRLYVFFHFSKYHD